MHTDEEQLIRDLAGKVEQDHPVTKDPDAAAVIDQTIASQPDAVYILTQAVLVQEQALHSARDQINSLNQALAEAQQRQAPPALSTGSGGGFMSHLFGQPAAAPQVASPQAVSPQVATPQAVAQPSAGGGFGGGGFLRNAATMAVGVVAGDTIFSGLSDMFG
jgi:hypothetical protein